MASNGALGGGEWIRHILALRWHARDMTCRGLVVCSTPRRSGLPSRCSKFLHQICNNGR